ncbi:MAG: type VI secretion system membrane subunit TssM [Cellvibrionaceae bacterium]|nr:type VI secretion system membrane subunit TssM [Cellvibrionaceae bacterium]
MIRKIFSFLVQPWLLSLLILMLIAAIIWFIGPLIAIAGYKPLVSEFVRLVTVIALLLAWGLNNLRVSKKVQNQDKEISQKIIDDSQKVSVEAKNPEEVILADRFNEAIKALQSSKMGKKSQLYTLPWYIIIGLPGSGKTTALKNSGLQFPLHNTFGDEPIQGAGGTRYCDWWFTNEAIMIDTAGRYTAQEDTKKTEAQSWLGFLNILKKGRPKRPLNGIVVTISVQDLLTKTATQRSLHATAIKQRVQELNHQLNMELPVYVVLTKVDTVAGFATFFDDMEHDEREQAWGFNFDNKPIEQENVFKTYFSEQYDALMANINNRVLYLLDHEKSQSRRNLIHQFPHQMSALKPVLLEFLNNIFTPNQFETPLIIRGTYFISSTQANIGSQWISASIPTDILNPPVDHVTGESKTFFVNHLFKNIIFKEANLASINHKSRRRFHWAYWSFIAALIIAFLGVLLAWQNSLSLNRDYISEVREDINKYLESTDGGLIDARNWLSLATGLNHLRDLSTGYDQGSKDYPFLQGLGLYQGHKVGSEASITYKKALHVFLMEDIGRLLQNQISVARNDEHLYEALKFYLMQYHSDKMDRETFLVWIDILLRRELSGEDNQLLRDHLKGHIRTALAENISPAAINQLLVDQARETLVLTPLDLRLYRRLKNDYQKNNSGEFSLTNLLGKKGDLVFYYASGKPLSSEIPNLFTFNGFHATFNVQNKQLAERLAGEQWIYGDSLPTDLSDEKIKKITQKVDEYYFDEYIEYWQTLINDIRIKPFDNINQAQALLRLLASSEKPLIKVISAIRKNTALDEVPVLSDKKKEAVGELAETFASNEKNRLERLTPLTALGGEVKLPGYPVSDNFASFNQYAQMEEGLPLAELQSSINIINNHFSKLANAGNVKEAALSANLDAQSGTNPIEAMKRSFSEAHPDIQRWVSNITTDANKVTASAAKEHVNNKWQSEVYSFYQKAIKGRYPVDPKSTRDIKLSDFAEFFGPNGIMQVYFDSTVKPFVDKSRRTWRWKKDINISNARLRIFQRADEIQKMYFNQGSASPEVAFLLKPLFLDKVTTGSLLEVGGQRMAYNHGPLRTQKINWPGDSAEHSKLTFTLASKGTPISSRAEGEWAWFRLLDEYSTVTPESNSDAVNIVFDVKGVKAQYLLTPKSSFNPFTNNVLKNFGIPSRL